MQCCWALLIRACYQHSTMQLVTGISRNTQSKSYTCMLSLTECVWKFQNDALWDTNLHALLVIKYLKKLKNLRNAT